MSDLKKDLTSTEKDALKRISLVLSLMIEVYDAFEERGKSIHLHQREMKTIITLITKRYTKILDTVPLYQLKNISENLKRVRYEIGVPVDKKHNPDEKYGITLSYDDIDTLALATRDCCLHCDRDLRSQKHCKLRNVYNLIGFLEKGKRIEDDGRECPYQTI